MDSVFYRESQQSVDTAERLYATDHDTRHCCRSAYRTSQTTLPCAAGGRRQKCAALDSLKISPKRNLSQDSIDATQEWISGEKTEVATALRIDIQDELPLIEELPLQVGDEINSEDEVVDTVS